MLLLALGVLATWTAAEAQPPVITITGADYAFSGVASRLQPGWRTFVFVNTGKEDHHAQIVRLRRGVTTQQALEALRKGEAAFFPLVIFVGGPGAIAPGARSQPVTLNLTPGDYLLLCLIPSPDGVPHVAKGMVLPFAVRGAKVGTRPSGRGDIVMRDFAFTLPRGFNGKGTYRVVNRGPQPHEIGINRLAPGKTLADVRAYLAKPEGPPPLIAVGGVQAIATGVVNYVRFDLEPGTYVATCFVPDPQSGKPHVALGMILPFDVK